MTIGVERPPPGTRHRKFSPFSFHVLMRPFSTEMPSRLGPRSSGQSPARTLRGLWAGSDTHSPATSAATRQVLFSMHILDKSLTRYAALADQCLRADSRPV